MKPATADASEVDAAVPDGAPIVVDIGKKRKKQIKDLRAGRGKLLDEVHCLLDDLRAAGSIAASAQPVIVVVQAKRKTRALPWPLA